MPLSVIGPGFGRTGTMSLKNALEILGFGPCHHMEEAVKDPAHVQHWVDYTEGRPVHWPAVFAGWKSQVDWPGAHVWRELAATFPEARVVLSVRPEESWWKSFSGTIGKLLSEPPAHEPPAHVQAMMGAAHRMIADLTFHGPVLDRELALAAYRRRIEDVKATIPAERLLVFDVAQGWEPLCRFLKVPVPNVPFPHHNSTAQFWELIENMAKSPGPAGSPSAT